MFQYPPFPMCVMDVRAIVAALGDLKARTHRVHCGHRFRPCSGRVTRKSFPTGLSTTESGFEENLDNAVNHFKLLWVAFGKERINPFADISWVFFPL